jgi:hypothetical protein
VNATTPADLEPLPGDAVLLHIGPHKTGTTAIQAALAASRDDLAARGVTYPGRGNQHSREAMAVLGATFGFRERGGGSFPMAEWDRLAAQTRRARGRVVISSEFFDLASAEQAEQVRQSLGGDRVQLVITLRPLARILPSSWQQGLKNGRTRPYDKWLEQVLTDSAEARAGQAFWTRHDHGALVERWAAVVGAEHVTVAVLDERDHAWLYHLFEGLLGLGEDFLTRPPGDRANRSMSALECELLRRVNGHVARQQVPWPDYQQVIRDGAFRRILTEREPGRGEGPISTPGWALDHAARFGADAAARIAASGVRVVGDLARLAEPTDPVPEAKLPGPAQLRLMVTLVVGALSGSMRRGPDFGDVRAGWPPPSPTLEGVPTRHLARVLRRRVTDRARARWRTSSRT